MGVIYKFKQEIVDYILQRKKAEPALSCRRLTAIVQERFQIEVSKSSVNAVLKGHSLSNPVGRQAKGGAPKNFFIPLEKKAAIRTELAPLLPVVLEAASVGDGPGAPVTISTDHPDQKESGQASGSFDGQDRGPAVQFGKPFEAEISVARALPGGTDKDRLGAVQDEASSSSVPAIEKTISDGAAAVTTGCEATEDTLEAAGFPEEQRPHLPLDLLGPQPAEEISGEEVQRFLGEKNLPRRAVWDEDGVVEHEQAIAVFLVASLWEADKKKELGDILAKAMAKRGKNVSVDLAEGVAALQGLGADVPSESVSAIVSGVAGLMGLDPLALEEAHKDVAGVLAADRPAALAYESVRLSLSTQAACFELSTSGGRKLFVDPLWSEFSSEPIFSSANGLSVPHALERLTAEFINNLEPLVMNIPEAQSVFTIETLEWLALIAGTEDEYIEAVAVLSGRGDCLVRFDRLPRIRRGVVLVGGFLESDYARIEFDTIGDVHDYWDAMTRKEFSYHEGRAVIGGKEIIQAYVVTDRSIERKFFILSNLKIESNQVESFFLDWKSGGLVDNFAINQKFCFKVNKISFYIKLITNEKTYSKILINNLWQMHRKNIITFNKQRLYVFSEADHA